MAMKRTFIVVAAISLIVVSLAVGILLASLAGGQEVGNLYTYPVSFEEKTCIITVRTNWTSEPKVELSPEHDP